MKTPHVQTIQDDVLARFPGSRAGQWNCRRIAGLTLWSQHAYTEEEYGYLGNAADIFPRNMAQGDQIAAYIRSEYAEIVKVVLWRVRDHFDHVHYDTWPTGIGTPPCKGGALRVRHEDGTIGRTFHVAPPPAPAPLPSEIVLPLVYNPGVSTQDVGLLQDLINETYYDAPALTTDGRYGNGTAAAVKKWLVPQTGDTDPEVLIGHKVNFRMWRELNKDWVHKITR